MGITQTVGNARRSGQATACTMERFERRVLMSGTVVNDYQLAAGKDASFSDLVEDAGGNLYASGTAKDAAGNSHALVRKGARQGDGSITWDSASAIDFSLAPSGTSSFKEAVIDPASGDLYAVGESKDAAGASHWVVVMRSSAGGVVSVVDDYRRAGSTNADARAIARDGAGNLFVAGAATSGTTSRWVVRELKAGTSAWATVQDFAVAPNVSTPVSDVVAAPSGVYVVGFGGGRWLTQRGVDNGAGGMTWTTVDDFRADAAFSSTALGVGADAAGNVYAVGSARRATGAPKGGVTPSVSFWTVRRTSNAGQTWATVDSFQLSGGTNLVHTADDFGTDPAGNLYVGGYAQGADGVNHAVVRTAGPGGGAWATLDDWQLTAGKNAFGSAFLADHAGTLYTAGNAADAANARHAYVRRINPAAGVSTTFSDTAILPAASDSSSVPITVLVLG